MKLILKKEINYTYYLLFIQMLLNNQMLDITFNNGYLGSFIEEERSKLRKVVWIAEPNESRNTRTHIAVFRSKEGLVSFESRKHEIEWMRLLTLSKPFCIENWTFVRFLKYYEHSLIESLDEQILYNNDILKWMWLKRDWIVSIFLSFHLKLILTTLWI